MGNTGKNGKARPKNQAPKIQESGSSTEVMNVGGSSEEQTTESEDISINLIKLNLSVCEQAKLGDLVNVQWQNGAYVVLLNGQNLGFVPGSYNTSLRPPTQHQGLISYIRLNPSPSVTIQVRIAT